MNQSTTLGHGSAAGAKPRMVSEIVWVESGRPVLSGRFDRDVESESFELP